MAARLPQPGGDPGNWGAILNEFLVTTHNSDGTLKSNSVTSNTIANGAVSVSKLDVATIPTNGQVLSYDGTSLAWTTSSSSGSVPDANASTKGLVQLAGDLGGTSSSPTVPGLANKANLSDVVTLAGAQTIAGVKNFTGTLQSGGTAVALTSDARFTNERTPSNLSVTTAKIVDGNVTTAKVADGAIGATQLATNAVTTGKVADGNITGAKIADNTITEPKLAISNTPSTSQVLSWNGTTLAWANPTTGGAGDPTMGGDLSGIASNAQIVSGAVGATELATNAVTTVKITDANVTTAKIADGNVTGAKIADNTVTEPKLAVSNSPANNQVLSWNGSALAWATPATGGSGSGWRAVSTSTAVTAVSGDFIICDTTASGYTVTLPAATNGAYVTVKKLTNNVNAVLVAPPSGQINAGSGTSTTISVNSYGMVADFIADGTTWHQVG